MDWRIALEEYIRAEALPVEKFGHQPRLYALTREIGAELVYDDDIVCAAAWLHDLGVFVGHRPEEPAALAQWDNTTYAVEQAPAVLARIGFPAAKVPAVLEVIRTHQPSGEPKSIEATILRDADILEQLGTIGILRTVCKVGRDTRFHTFTDAVVSLRRALDTLPTLIHLDSARKLAMPRVQFLRNFIACVEHDAMGHLH